MSAYHRIYAAVRRIPKGKIATYGDVARQAGLPGHARMVGYALAALEDDDVPWHRVINAQGRVSLRRSGADEQRDRLSREGVTFDSGGRVDMENDIDGATASPRYVREPSTAED